MLKPLVRTLALGAALFATYLATPTTSSALPTCPQTCTRVSINCEKQGPCTAGVPSGPMGQCMSSTGIIDLYQIFCSCAGGGAYYVNCIDP
jgi:hypothetical protein